jgi:ethanolamine transporter EutH
VEFADIVTAVFWCPAFGFLLGLILVYIVCTGFVLLGMVGGSQMSIKLSVKDFFKYLLKIGICVLTILLGQWFVNEELRRYDLYGHLFSQAIILVSIAFCLFVNLRKVLASMAYNCDPNRLKKYD